MEIAWFHKGKNAVVFDIYPFCVAYATYYSNILSNSVLRSRYQLNPQLGIWVNNQRTQYRAFKEGRVGPMTADRAKRLDEIGFIWNVSKRRIGTRNMQCSSTYPKQKSYKTVRKALSFPVVSPTDDDSFFSPDSSADIAAAARVLQRMQKLAVKRRYRLI